MTLGTYLSVRTSHSCQSDSYILSRCAVDKELIFDFEENLGSWFDRGLEIPTGTLLMSEGEEEEGEGEGTVKPVLSGHSNEDQKIDFQD